jgi:STE24 endopeptidase
LRFLLLIPLFLIWDYQSPATEAWLLLPPHLGVPIFFLVYALLILLVRIWGRRLAYAAFSGSTGRAIDRFNHGMTIARLLIPAWFGVGVFLLGWGNPLLGPLGRLPAETPAMIVGILPGLVAWMGLWWGQFPVDRAMREQNALYQLESDLPVFAPTNFRGYFIHKLRVQLLFILMPWLLIKALRDAVEIAWISLGHTSAGQRMMAHVLVRDYADSTLSFGCVLFVLLISPELLRRVLHTERLPDLPLRKSLTEICQRSGVQCREILLWRTDNNMGNAAMMGLIPLVRYVMLSDLLLESMTDEQIQAVFAHELGHVKHRHLVWFVAFLLTFSSAIVGVMAKIEGRLKLTVNQEMVYDVASAAGTGLVLVLVYGFLSRWFERQADVYAARTIQLGETESDPAKEHVGAAVFASALQRVALVNNIPENARNWTHGSIAARVRYIRQFGRDPLVAERFDRTGRRVVLGLSALIILCTFIAVYSGLR